MGTARVPNRKQRRKLNRDVRREMQQNSKLRAAVSAAAKQRVAPPGIYLPGAGPKTSFVLPPGFVLPSSVQHNTERH